MSRFPVHSATSQPCVHIHTFVFIFFSFKGYKTLSRTPCAVQKKPAFHLFLYTAVNLCKSQTRPLLIQTKAMQAAGAGRGVLKLHCRGP